MKASGFKVLLNKEEVRSLSHSSLHILRKSGFIWSLTLVGRKQCGCELIAFGMFCEWNYRSIGEQE